MRLAMAGLRFVWFLGREDLIHRPHGTMRLMPAFILEPTIAAKPLRGLPGPSGGRRSPQDVGHQRIIDITDHAANFAGIERLLPSSGIAKLLRIGQTGGLPSCECAVAHVVAGVRPQLAVTTLVSSSAEGRLQAMFTMTWIKSGWMVARVSAAAPYLAYLIEINAGGPPLSFSGAASQEATMAMDFHISFRGMEPSPTAEAQVRRRVDELEQFSDRISACRVVLEAVGRHHQHGRIYHARVDLTVSGGKVVANREPA